ncbi:MAG: MBL fold metallo-hydrolase [Bacteroidetes bacterium]|nr:MBL fold metallo-hydrolase [Bacteroidota bacterium]
MKNLISAISVILFTLLSISKILADNTSDKVAIMTYVSDREQERSVKAMIKSIRDNAGEYKNCKIYVLLTDFDRINDNSLKGSNVELLKLDIEKSILDYPLAIKAFAASQVEQLVRKEVRSLIWLDPGVIVLSSLESFDLNGEFDVAVRPVSLVNNIGLAPDVEPNDYWTPIYKANKLNYKTIQTIETAVDGVKIQPYYNCEVYSVNPKLGLCKDWAAQLSTLLKDENYQKNTCTTFQRRLFLHQAVLSGVVASRIKSNKIKPIPITSSYPFNQHDQLPDSKKVSSLNELSVVIFDYAWSRIPTWMNKISINEPLKSWLFDTYLDYLQLTENLYRIEGSSNSYLIATSEGSVLIDPAGASIAPEFYKKVLEKNPLKAILLTHAHQDHSDDIAVWRDGKDIPVIAQREYTKYFEYQTEFAPFFARRNAIWSRKPIPTEIVIKPDSRNEPTIFFADSYTYELGGIHFNMIHTPGETPDHTTIWIPELSAVLVGDNYYEYFINNSTFRGTMIRPIKGYLHALDTALSFQPELFLMGHGISIETNEAIKSTVGNFRDGLKYVYSETVKGINEGQDVYTLMQTINVPQEYGFAPFSGKVEWTIRGIYQEYVGWFDENPATMYTKPVASIFPDLIELAGIEPLVNRAKQLLEDKEYVKVLHITEIILSKEPLNLPANEIRLQALESLRASTYNYIERIWLDYAIGICKQE